MPQPFDGQPAFVLNLYINSYLFIYIKIISYLPIPRFHPIVTGIFLFHARVTNAFRPRIVGRSSMARIENEKVK